MELVLFESYYEPYGDGALSAVVSIQSHNVQIYSSTLTVDANFSGFTYVLLRVPLSAALYIHCIRPLVDNNLCTMSV